MSTPDGYVRELKTVDDTISRYNILLKSLREKKKTTQTRLYAYMEKNNLEEYGGYKASKLAPRKKVPRKKDKDKKD